MTGHPRLDAATSEPFTHAGRTHVVHRWGEGPTVIVAAEMPGITPTVIAFADRLVDAGLSVALPSLFGTDGAPSGAGRAVRVMLGACVSREFHCLALRDDSPATDWLRALARHERDRSGAGVGFVGMCFTGGFGLAMLLDDAVIAPVLSQPSLPLAVTRRRRASVGLDDDQLAVAAERARHCGVLGLRFTGDRFVPAERFATLRAALGENFHAVEIPSPDPELGIPADAHSVLTEHLVDEPGHPTRRALDTTIEFLASRLGV